jgi:hypothetical protein
MCGSRQTEERRASYAWRWCSGYGGHGLLINISNFNNFFHIVIPFPALGGGRDLFFIKLNQVIFSHYFLIKIPDMRKLYSYCLLLTFTTAVSFALNAQNFFTDEGSNRTFQTNGNRALIPDNYRAYSLDVQSLRNYLWTLPSEQSLGSNRNTAPVIQLPMPDGSMARFRVWESSVMAPELAAKYPELRSFTGQGIDDPYATLKMDFNPYTGFHAQILSFAKGRVYIDPYARGDMRYYMSYFAKDFTPEVKFICGVVDEEIRPENNIPEAACLGTTLRTYRLALACTGEYSIVVAAPNPPSVAASMAAINIAMNRVNGVYQTEVALTMTLIPNNDLLIFLDPNTDPYTNSSGSAMLGQNQATIDAIIGSANYDIGHVFSTGGGGVANLNGPCNPTLKARGVTGLPNPVGDPFYIDYVAHEMGHQWGANHSMAGCGSSPANTKYEVGSGTTIQGYAGICGVENIQPNSDPYFHAISFDEMSNFIVVGVGSGGGPTCGVMTSTGNALPVINPLPFNGVSIPPLTPFTLTGTATDPNGDALTYSWEQWDLQGTQTWNAGATAPANNTVPLFKARIPKTTGERTIPDIAVILAGYPANPPATMGGLKGETLSPVPRAMKFRLNVRDNRAGGSGTVSLGSGGCQDPTTYQINVVGSAPFVVTSPNGGENLIAGNAQLITWDNAGTNVSPFNVLNVKISLSTDGGLTYPTVLSASTPNDGSELLLLPCITTTTARIKIEAVNNIFFDISNANFSISQGFTFDTPGPVNSPCPVPTSLSTALGTITACGFSNSISLSASGNPPGTTVTFSDNPVTPGNSVTVTLNGASSLAAGSYNITIIGNASGAPVQTRVITFIINTPTPPSITSQPQPQTICEGSDATFNVIVTGASEYQWQISSGGGPFSDILGATSTSYTVTGATAGMNGNQYRIIAKEPCGTSTTSNAATLTVNTPITITNQPTARNICATGNTNFSVTATGTSPIYQWQLSTNGGTSWNNIANGGVYSGVTTPTLSLANITADMNGNLYRVVITGAAPCGSVNSAGAALNVTPQPVITASPFTSLLPGRSTTLSVNVSPAPDLTFAWTLNGNPLAGATGNSVVATVTDLGNYQVTITNTTTGVSCQSQVRNIKDSASSKLFIFPSPNNGQFTVSYYNPTGASTSRTVTIYDSRGARVYNRRFTISGPYTLIPVDLRPAQGGIYQVVVGDAGGNKLISGKVMVAAQ